ncbi:hypothetical protein [Devosia sp. SL43]|uniref:hypothetical protein n=1 Tax=Devosia sp. SL43 TaxID=2806348 RepID=UPI001F2DB378|nr:hypothetical protein [Devosia sp. SL43]UJW83931.1 hypothetical protein IM737_10665 [Devosia sp. SL43]
MRLALASLLAFALLATPSFAQSEEDVMAQIESIHGDSVGFGEAFGLLQDAFMFGDPVTIADLGFYPMTVNANGEVYDIFEAQDLVDNFDALLTSETQNAIGGQDFADLIVTSEGVGFANGALWMTNVCLDDGCAQTQWGILSINN